MKMYHNRYDMVVKCVCVSQATAAYIKKETPADEPTLCSSNLIIRGVGV